MNSLKLAILIISLLLTDFKFIHSQPINFAVISDPLIGLTNSEYNLNFTIAHLNTRNDLDFVIIFGNISNDGLYQKLNTADNLFSELKLPYYTAPGISDISKSLSGGVDYLQTLGRDGFSFNFNGINFISINSAIPFNPYLQRINVDELRWINDFITSSGSDRLFLFSSTSPEVIQNTNDLHDIISKTSYTQIFGADVKQYSREKFGDVDVIRLPRSSEKEIAYNTVRLENDTLFIFRRILSDKSDLLVDMMQLSQSSVPEILKKEIEVYSDLITVKKIINLNETHLAKAVFKDGLIFTTSKNGSINAIDKQGNIRWDYYTGGTSFNPPDRFRDLLAAVIYESDLITLNANNGDVFQIMGLSENISAPPLLIDVVHNGVKTKGIIVSTSSGDIFCYELFSLELIWNQKSINWRMLSAPLQHGNMLIFCNLNGEVFALNSDNGTLIWRYRVSRENKTFINLTSPVTDGRNVYVLFDENILTAIDLLQGTQRWINTNIPHQHSLIVKDDKHLLIKGKDNNYILLSSSDGKLVRSFPSFSTNYFPSNFLMDKSFILNGNAEGDILMINSNLLVNKLLNTYNTPVVSITKIDDNSFVSLDTDGNLIFFDITK